MNFHGSHPIGGIDYPRTLQEFDEWFSTEQGCLDYLQRLRWPDGFICPICNGRKVWQMKFGLFRCAACQHKVSVIAGTIFQGTRKPLKLWFQAIWYVTSQKFGGSALGLKGVLGLNSYQTAWSWLHKMRRAMVKPGRSLLSGRVEVDETLIGGKEHGGKRGRGAEDKTPFIAAVMTNEEGHPLFMRLSEVTGFTKGEITCWAKKHLVPGTIVVSDGLNCFPGVRDAGCSHRTIITGGGPDSVNIPEFKWVNTMIGNVKNSIRGSYHAISQDHIPRYLAEFCFRRL